ncbi:MAG: PP2C family protein-serine/threonine phosphatase [Terriglobia bacterium]
MGSPTLTREADRPVQGRDREAPHFRLHSFTVFVREMGRSLGFYVEQLGLRLLGETHIEIGRWVAVAPPDGTAILLLVEPEPDSEEYKLIGRSRHAIFVSEDVAANFQEWSKRGVRFHQPPQAQTWGGTQTRFEDPDGNSFVLLGYDAATREFEAERRAAQELEIAKEVQARLFPQKLKPLNTLDYAGICLQARAVGGDYYDFIDPGPNRLALVVGDIAGKGIAAALLMASLHASLRSQRTIALGRPQRLLRSVNEFFCENTTDNVYATVLFAEYVDKLRRLRYANCGHLPALLLRSDHSLERLGSACPPVGLFREWNCSVEERQLSRGDILVLYTDGVTESINGEGEEFGEQRLVEAVWRHSGLSSPELVAAVAGQVRQFSPDEQADDITLIIAKCR